MLSFILPKLDGSQSLNVTCSSLRDFRSSRLNSQASHVRECNLKDFDKAYKDYVAERKRIKQNRESSSPDFLLVAQLFKSMPQVYVEHILHLKAWSLRE